jgi:hypothetical protein
MPTWLLIVFYVCLPGFLWGFTRTFVSSVLRSLIRALSDRKMRCAKRDGSH